MKQKLTIEIDVPEGYELTGEYDHADKGDLVIRDDGTVIQYPFSTHSQHKYPHVRPIGIKHELSHET